MTKSTPTSQEGYARLALLMSSAPETAIFRRFGSLTTLNLLRLQAELQDLEQQLHDIQAEDGLSNDPDRTTYACDFRLMRDCSENGDSLQHEMLLDIGEKLKEYHNGLSLDLPLHSASAPSKSDLQFLSTWLKRPGMGNNFLSAPEDGVWDEVNNKDLITLRSQKSEEDLFSGLLNGAMLDLYHRILGHRRKKSGGELGDSVAQYNDRHIMQVGNVISATLSSCFQHSPYWCCFL